MPTAEPALTETAGRWPGPLSLPTRARRARRAPRATRMRMRGCRPADHSRGRTPAPAPQGLLAAESTVLRGDT